MTQDDMWRVKCQEIMEYIETNHRNPSRHKIEEHDYLNWIKYNRKLLNAGKMKADRIECFQKLLDLGEKYKHKNQYE